MTSAISSTLNHPLVPNLSARSLRVLMIALCTLFVANIYDPGGALGLKYPAVSIAAICSLWTLRFIDLSLRETIGILTLFVVWPCWSLFFGAVRKADMSAGVTLVTPFLFALILSSLLSALNRRLCLRLFYVCMSSLAVFILVSFALMFFLPSNPVSIALYDFLTSMQDTNNGFFGIAAWEDVEAPGIYFGSTLFLVPTFVYFLFAGKPLRAGIVLLALALTWSKSGVLISMGFAVIYSISSIFSGSGSSALHKVKTPGRGGYLRASFALLLLAGVSALVFLSFPGFAGDIQDAISGQADTSVVRLQHIDSVLQLWNENPHYLLIGQGSGMPFYTTAQSDYVQSFEVTYLDAIRKFGLPWFLGFSGLALLVPRKLIASQDTEKRAFGYAMISMFLAAGTNPVLITPLFIMLLTLTYFVQRSDRAWSD